MATKQSFNSSTLLDRFNQLPRSMRWLLIAVLVVVGVFVVDDYVWSQAREWRDQAARLESDLAAARAASTRLAEVDRMKAAIENLGPVRVPRPLPDAEGRDTAALNNAVNEVLKKYPVSNDRFDAKGVNRLPTGVLLGLISGNQRAAYVSGELKFEGNPDDVIAIIADLEASADIDAVSTVRIAKATGAARRLSVTLTVEAWTISAGGGGGAAAGRGGLS